VAYAPQVGTAVVRQDKTEKCLKTCGQDRWGCQVYCSRDDNECTRACVAAYDKCIDVCGGAKK